MYFLFYEKHLARASGSYLSYLTFFKDFPPVSSLVVTSYQKTFSATKQANVNIALTVFYTIRNGSTEKWPHCDCHWIRNYCIEGRRLKAKQEISCQVLLVRFTPNIRNGLASQIRPDAEAPALVQQIKAPLIGTIIVTGRGRIRGSNEVTGKWNTDESDTRGRLLQRRGNTSCGGFSSWKN